MLKNNPILLFSIPLIIAITACIIPAGQNPESSNLALTITAQALLLQADAQQPGVAQATATLLTASTATPEFTPTITLTPTPSVPTVTVSTDTNCRTGPGLQYDRIAALLVGQSAEVVGKNSASNYWIIKTPGGIGNCWLWGQYATVSGNTSNLIEVPIPATPTPAVPAPVKNLESHEFCSPAGPPNTYNLSGTIVWEDNSNNEEGFNVYLNGGLHGTVGEDVESYPMPPLALVPDGQEITISVEAFNGAGKSAVKNVTFSCP